jgi:EAL domain-containing protein (putative c-di-GMP-specific phosphodiesterase class I)
MSAADDMASRWAPAAPDACWRGWAGFAAHVERAIDAGGAVLLRLDLLDMTDLEGTYGARAIAVVRAATQARLHAAVGPGGAVIGDGGTRFAACVAGPRDVAEIGRAAELLCIAAMAPVSVLGQPLRPSVCVGAAQSAPGRGVALLRTCADAAVEEARRAGAGAHRLYSAEMRDGIRDRTVLLQALRQAIAERQIRLHYQPVVAMADRSLIGAEALARWDHPDLGPQSPAQFIPVAEDTGLIVPLGEQLLDIALAQARAWATAGHGAPRVAVNVSGVQLRRPDFAASVGRALDRAGVAPALLELELTEGALIDSGPHTQAALAGLAGMGITLAVDDFGTGYASLRYLRDLPVQKLKIDQTFVRNIAVDPRDAAIVAAIVAMARGLGLTTTAEGVQTEAQYRQLRDAGCDQGQGWLFGAPIRPEAFPGPPL